MKNRLKKLAALASFAAAAPRLFAVDLLPAEMTTLVDDIFKIFTGGFVKVILVICLCGCAIAYGFNKDNEKMKRNCIAIGIAVAVLIGASTIVGAVWEASGGGS